MFQRASFVKTFVLSKALHAAQVLACPKNIAVAINKAVSIFLWRGKRERTKPGIVFQTAEKGGLGSLHVGTFFNAILARTTFMILNGKPGPERRMLEFWLSFPLRNVFKSLYKGNSTPKAVLSIPDYLENFVSLMKELKEEGLINGDETSINHKTIYNMKIKGLCCDGKLLAKLTGVEWDRVWKNMRKLPHHLREIMFMFNHDILPSKERMKRMDPRTDDKCSQCGMGTESSLHALIECPKKIEIVTWLKNQLCNMGITGNIARLIRLDLPRSRKASLLVASFVHSVWGYRNEKHVITTNDIQKAWLIEKEKPTETSDKSNFVC